MKTRTLLAALATIALVAGSASAAIVIDNSFAGNLRDGFGSQTATVAGVNATGSDKIVVVTATEHNFGGTSAPGVPIVQLNGVDLDVASTSYNNGSARVSILYLDNPGNGDLTINSNGGSNGQAWHVYLLSGTLDGIGASNAAVGTSTSLVTTADNSWVLSGLFTDGPNAAEFTAPTADAPQTATIPSEGWNPGRIYGITSSAHQDGGLSGSNVTASWSGGGSVDSIALVEFLADPIPEPSSLALLGLGGLLIARRRRG